MSDYQYRMILNYNFNMTFRKQNIRKLTKFCPDIFMKYQIPIEQDKYNWKISYYCFEYGFYEIV